MAGTKQIRLGKVERFTETLEQELKLLEAMLQHVNLFTKEPTYRASLEGEIRAFKRVIKEIKEEFGLE